MRHGSPINPPNRYQQVHCAPDAEHLEWDQEYLRAREDRKIEYFDDAARSIVSENDSPDVPFRYSANPYRGCAHGCVYCYARNTHEYLGLSAGLDFETKIFVKRDAPQLLREFLLRKSWQPAPIAFSGATDCYQPAERAFRLTRACLEVAQEFRQPIGITTKNALVVRDLDLLAPMARQRLANVNISLTTLDPELARSMEPRTSIPSARLRAIRDLSAAGVPVRVLLSPIIPGLNDHEIPALLGAAREAGAGDAAWILLRLPQCVEDIFRHWLRNAQPLKVEKVEGLIRQTRDGRLGDSTFGRRMRGTGPLAEQIEQLFDVFARKFALDGGLPKLDASQFAPPEASDGQLRLF